MPEGFLLDLWRDALVTLTKSAAPFLIVAFVVGLVTAIVQAATQLQEAVLTFVPKIIATVLVIVLGGSFVLEVLGQHTARALRAPQTMADWRVR